MKQLAKIVYTIIYEEAQKLNLTIEDIIWETVQHHNYLRVIADSKPALTIDECSALNEALSLRLDQSDPIEDEYFLEVSSPGLERPLKKPEDFLRFIGSYIYLKTYQAINGKKEFYGTLSDYTEVALKITLVIKNQETVYEIKHEQISQVRLAVKF